MVFVMGMGGSETKYHFFSIMLCPLQLEKSNCKADISLTNLSRWEGLLLPCRHAPQEIRQNEESRKSLVFAPLGRCFFRPEGGLGDSQPNCKATLTLLKISV